METIQRVPPEIWHCILAGEDDHGHDFCPPRELQRTCLSLLLALPAASVDPRLLYRHLVVARPGQLWPLYRHLSGFHATDETDARPPSRSFEMRSWTGDADMLVNILGQLPELRKIAINVGTNFAPEHLEDVFFRPRPPLRQIVLRFRPYVDRASYHQFLAGAYHDVALQALARWPAASSTEHALRYVSIVQDVAPRHLVDSSAPQPVLDPDADPRRKEEERVKGRGRYTGHGPFPYLDERLTNAQPKTFAQPIVFFNMSCVTELAASPVAAHVSHLRLRIPLRDVVTSLVASPNSFPALRFLDLSTSNLRMHTHLPTLLGHYPNLQHLVLDHTNLFGWDKGGECARELGKLIAMGGMGRSKEREREIARWEEAAWRGRTSRRLEAARQANGHPPPTDATVDEAADELAQLTTQEYNPQARRRNVRSMAHSTFTIRPTTSSTTPGGAIPHQATQPLTPYHPESIAFVLPSLPALESLCLGGEAPLSPAQRREWQRSFDAGWRDGLAKLVEWSIKGVGERFERARRKAEVDRKEWDKWLARQGGPAGSTANGTPALQQAEGALSPSRPSSATHKGKGKAKASTSSSSAPGSASPSKPLPPPKVLLYRFPSPSESVARARSLLAPASDLIEVVPTSDWRSAYTRLLDGDVACSLCLVPDAVEGPLRRGGNGELAEHDDEGDEDEGDGESDQGGSSQAHSKGCGHRVGAAIWDE